MKTAEEKARELIRSFKPFSHFWVHDLGRQKDYDIEQFENAKQCVLICVDEIIQNIKATIFYHKDSMALPINLKFWQEVKQKINEL